MQCPLNLVLPQTQHHSCSNIMISSLIFLGIFMVCCQVSCIRRSGSNIVTPIGGSPNSIPQPYVPNTQIDGNMMLTTPTSSPTIMSAPPPITAGMVPPTVSATVTPVQVINSPFVFILNESFILSSTPPASNPLMAPGAAPFSPPITMGTVISSPVEVVTSPIVPIVNDSLMLSSSTLDIGTVPSNGANSIPPTLPIVIDPASMMTGTAAPANIPSATPVDITTFISSINESFMIQRRTENTVTTASPVSVTSPPLITTISILTTVTSPLTTVTSPSLTTATSPLTTVTSPLTTVTSSLLTTVTSPLTIATSPPSTVSSPLLTTVTSPPLTTATSPLITVTSPLLTTVTSPLLTTVTSPPITTATSPLLTTVTSPPLTTSPLTTVTSPSLTTATSPLTTVTSPPLTTTISPLNTVTSSPLTTVTSLSTTTTLGFVGSTPNIGSVTTGTTETATSSSTITTAHLPISTPVNGTIILLMEASTITATSLEAALDSAVTDTATQPMNSSSLYNEKTEAGVIVGPIEIANISDVRPILGIAIPSEIKIYLNISSLPSISVHISTEPPQTEVTDDTVIVEIIRGNERFNISSQDIPSVSVNVSPNPPVTEVTEEAVEIIEGNKSTSMSPQFQDIIFETTTENTVSEAPIYIDLSDPNRVDVDFGTTTSRPQITSTVPPIERTTSASVTTSSPIVKRKFEEKCMEYYNIGKRITRKTKVQVFIIGGENSGQKEFPHMAALGYGKQNQQQWLCGGSLISENYVITAAHCLSARALGEIRYVRLGTTTLQTETLNSEDFNVIRRIPHPAYIQGKQFNDIALLQLDRPVNMSDYIAPICLSNFKDFANTKLTALGWGRLEADGDTSLELQKVELEYFPNDVCRKAYDGISMEDLPGGISEDTQICAGAVDGSRDTCQGDSGGPLQFQQDGRMYLAGITSFGIGCGRADSPGVYTRVSYYISWIESTIW